MNDCTVGEPQRKRGQRKRHPAIKGIAELALALDRILPQPDRKALLKTTPPRVQQGEEYNLRDTLS